MLDLDRKTVASWVQRQQDGVDIWEAPRPGCGPTYLKDMEDRFIAFYCQTTPLDGYGRWSLRTAEEKLRTDPGPVGAAISRSTMQRILSRHALRPHLNRYFLHISDPDFFPKMEPLVGLYLNPPKYLFCFDESPGIQVLERIAPDMRPGDDEQTRRWLSEFEYIRNGTMDLFAFLEVRTSKVTSEVHADHKKETFISVFRAHFLSLPESARAEGVHYIMDNLDCHRCYEFCQAVAELCEVECPPLSVLTNQDRRREWLQSEGKRIVIHFTPFHGSWLNMVEIWFRIAGSKCLKDSYSDPDELCEALMRFAQIWSDRWARPFRWKYDGTGLHQKAVSRLVAFLKHSAAKLRPQFIKKQALLMLNLMNYYQDRVDEDVWRKLVTAVKEAAPALHETIEKSDQPIVKKQAYAALNTLLGSIDAILEKLAA